MNLLDCTHSFPNTQGLLDKCSKFECLEYYPHYIMLGSAQTAHDYGTHISAVLQNILELNVLCNKPEQNTLM